MVGSDLRCCLNRQSANRGCERCIETTVVAGANRRRCEKPQQARETRSSYQRIRSESVQVLPTKMKSTPARGAKSGPQQIQLYWFRAPGLLEAHRLTDHKIQPD